MGTAPLSPRGPTCRGLGVVAAAEGLQLAGAVVGGAGDAPSPLGAVPLDQPCRTRRDLRGAEGVTSGGTPEVPGLGQTGTAAWDPGGPAVPSLLDPVTALPSQTPSLPHPSQIPLLLPHPITLPSFPDSMLLLDPTAAPSLPDPITPSRPHLYPIPPGSHHSLWIPSPPLAPCLELPGELWAGCENKHGSLQWEGIGN